MCFLLETKVMNLTDVSGARPDTNAIVAVPEQLDRDPFSRVSPLAVLGGGFSEKLAFCVEVFDPSIQKMHGSGLIVGVRIHFYGLLVVDGHQGSSSPGITFPQ